MGRHDGQRTARSRLKRNFHVVNLHDNNHTCNTGQPPFPAAVYEVLFVSKRIGVLDPSGNAALASPLDAPNDPTVPDCQIVTPQ